MVMCLCQKGDPCYPGELGAKLGIPKFYYYLPSNITQYLWHLMPDIDSSKHVFNTVLLKIVLTVVLCTAEVSSQNKWKQNREGPLQLRYKHYRMSPFHDQF